MLLGMRHGLDPDHLAIVNGINLNAHSKSKSNIWGGLFFSSGHGFTVTIIGVLIIGLSDSLKYYKRIFEFTEWIPIVLLLFTGLFGVYTIYSGLVHKGNNHSHKKLSTFISQSKYPALKLFLTGILFALVFDTSTQVAAWGLVGEGITRVDQYSIAIFIGLFFTAGMMVTDTLNGLFFYRILNAEHSKFNLKIFLSLLVVLTSLTLGAIQLFEKLGMSIEIPDLYKLIWGASIMALTLVGILVNYLQFKEQEL
jgi:high-affinity nickel-transport protein